MKTELDGLCFRLKSLSKEIEGVADLMALLSRDTYLSSSDTYAEFAADALVHAVELRGAAQQTREWAEDIEDLYLEDD